MANSLRAKISKLRHDRNITEEEYQELISKLDGHDKQIRAEAEKELEELRAEIAELHCERQAESVFIKERDAEIRAEAIDEFWTEFDRQIKTIGRQAYYYTDFLVIGMKIREKMKEQNND